MSNNDPSIIRDDADIEALRARVAELEEACERLRDRAQAIVVWIVEGEGYYALRTKDTLLQNTWSDPDYYCGPAATPEEALAWANE